jgi:LemA protein
MVGFIILGVVVVLLAVFLIGIYNSLVQLRQRVQNAWSQVDVQLKLHIPDKPLNHSFILPPF